MVADGESKEVSAITQQFPAGPARYFFDLHPGQGQGVSGGNGGDAHADGGGRGDDLGDQGRFQRPLNASAHEVSEWDLVQVFRLNFT